MIHTRIVALLKHHGYHVATRPYELNIVGLRNRRRRANKFDDELHVFYWLPSGKIAHHRFVATTDPGVFWLTNPIAGGTAILKQGQYVNAYAIGMHHNTSKALVQVKPVTVMRDDDGNSKLNFKSREFSTGLFGINIHRAYGSEPRKYVDRNSAGCQVIAHDLDFDKLLALAERHRELYGNRFTYSLMDLREMRNETLMRVLIGGGIVASALTAYLKPEWLTQFYEWLGIDLDELQ